jgi:hypothetical protein
MVCISYTIYSRLIYSPTLCIEFRRRASCRIVHTCFQRIPPQTNHIWSISDSNDVDRWIFARSLASGFCRGGAVAVVDADFDPTDVADPSGRWREGIRGYCWCGTSLICRTAAFAASPSSCSGRRSEGWVLTRCSKYLGHPWSHGIWICNYIEAIQCRINSSRDVFMEILKFLHLICSIASCIRSWRSL